MRKVKIPFQFNTQYSKTWFIDLDGTILEFEGLQKKGKDTLLPGVLELWNTIDKDDMIIIVTGRSSSYRDETEKFLKQNNIRYDYILFDLNMGERIVINDNKHDGSHTAFGWCVERNKGFTLIADE
jgi:hydroxymethylpyrimidine pyrophosphatase-like HAD family hydrolase